MFRRSDAEAINAACRAFERSHEAKTGVIRWPGTVHIEAAVDAYLQARGIGDTGPAATPFLAMLTDMKARITALEASMRGARRIRRKAKT